MGIMAEPNGFSSDLSQDVRWQLDAACLGLTDLFFAKGRSDISRWEQGQAKGVCRGCGVRTHCFEAAFARDEPGFGVWAGLSEDEHRSLDRSVRRVVARTAGTLGVRGFVHATPSASEPVRGRVPRPG